MPELARPEIVTPKLLTANTSALRGLCVLLSALAAGVSKKTGGGGTVGCCEIGIYEVAGSQKREQDCSAQTAKAVLVT